MAQSIILDVGQGTDRGRARQSNEDALGTPEGMGITPADIARKGRLYIICDGMGGQDAGEVASRLAVQTLFQSYYSDAAINPQESLQRAVHQANAAVYAAAQADPSKQDMGTTLVAAVLQGDQAFIASVGDSRAYLVNPAGIRQVTTDHTWVQDRVTEGTLKPEQARQHLYRSVLSRALGVKPAVQADFFQERLSPGEALLLCSDGLYNKVSNQELQGIVLSSRTAQSAVGRLVALANQRGGDDNITAVVLRLPGPAVHALTFPNFGPMPVPPLGLAIAVAGLVLILLLFVVLPQRILPSVGRQTTPTLTTIPVLPSSTPTQSRLIPTGTAVPALPPLIVDVKTEGPPSYWKKVPDLEGKSTWWTWTNDRKYENWGEWQLNISERGFYEISVWIPTLPMLTQKAQYEIYGSNKDKADAIIPVDQEGNQGKWVNLGQHFFELGERKYLGMNDKTGEHFYGEKDPRSRRIAFGPAKFIYQGR